MGILKSLTQVLLNVSQHCQDGEGGRSKKLSKKQFFPLFLSLIAGLSILELSRTVIYEFWYDYVQPK